MTSPAPSPSPRTSAWGTPIIDFHCHFPTTEPEPPVLAAYRAEHGQAKYDKLQADARWYQEQWWDHYNFPYPEDDEPAPAIQRDRWHSEIEDAGLTAVVFATGGGNPVLAQAIAGEERMVGFAHHDPFSPNAAHELRRAVLDDGMRGYKVIAPDLPGPIDDKALYPLWQTAEDLGIPVLIHFGPSGGGGGTAWGPNIDPLRLHNVAKAFCYTDFVIPHFGCGYPTELLHLMWAARNVSVDTSGNNEWLRWMATPMTLTDMFRRFYETVGPERIVFASDSCSFPRGLARAYYDEQIRIVGQLGIPANERALIFHDNAARMLGWAPATTDSGTNA